jgi:hypothetical protein
MVSDITLRGKMKKIAYVVLLILMGMLVFLVLNNLPQKKYWDENTPLPEFMIGRWKGDLPMYYGDGAIVIKYQLKSTKQNRFKICHVEPADSSCEEYTYQLISDNVFKLVSDDVIRGGIIQEWRISRNGDNLVICMNPNPLENTYCITFIRDDSIWFW